ncbi:MAG: cytochrome c biosis protein transrane region [Geminicoccaceae bacterium]|nr:cytochrome c biosis protein transrane region [Geminicoccaceae bacterium]
MLFPPPPGLETTLREQPLVALAILFGAGLATSLTPCVYPMIPITAGILGGTASTRRSRGRTALLTAVYVLGLALVYSILGLLAGLSGSLFGAVSSSPWALFIMGNLLLVFGLGLLDVFTVNAPSRVMAWTGRISGDSVGGVFALGATSGLVAAPCGAPAFAAVLTFVSTTQSALMGFLYLFVFSVGLSALLVAVGLFSGSLAALPKAGKWTLWIKRAGGVLLLLMSEYYFVRMGRVL